MSEIDKLINQAFPDELRDVEPVDVDEDAILAMTLESLGLDTAPKIELPELTVKPRRKSRPETDNGSEQLVEAPPVHHNRWLDWAGWAIAACLVLVCAVNWGPWLINNLDFGIGPRSTGKVSESSKDGGSAPEVRAYTPAESFDVAMSISKVTVYNSLDRLDLDLTFSSLVNGSELNLDQFDITLESISDEDVTRVSRSSSGSFVYLTYYLDGANQLLLTVRRLVPLLDERGQEVGFTYQNVDQLDINLYHHTAQSRFTGSRYEFTFYNESAPPEPAPD